MSRPENHLPLLPLEYSHVGSSIDNEVMVDYKDKDIYIKNSDGTSNSLYEIYKDKILDECKFETEKTNKVYGIDIDMNNSDPDGCVTYTDDAVGLDPLTVDVASGKCNYGSWGNIIDNELGVRPCILKNGKVFQYLNKNDYTLDVDGNEASIDGKLKTIDKSAHFQTCATSEIVPMDLKYISEYHLYILAGRYTRDTRGKTVGIFKSYNLKDWELCYELNSISYDINYMTINCVLKNTYIITLGYAILYTVNFVTWKKVTFAMYDSSYIIPRGFSFINGSFKIVDADGNYYYIGSLNNDTSNTWKQYSSNITIVPTNKMKTLLIGSLYKVYSLRTDGTIILLDGDSNTVYTVGTTSDSLYDIICSKSSYICVGANGFIAKASSSNLSTWTKITTSGIPSGFDIGEIIYDEATSRYIIKRKISISDTYYSSKVSMDIMYSTDLINWSYVDSSVYLKKPINCIAIGDKGKIAMACNGLVYSIGTNNILEKSLLGAEYKQVVYYSIRGLYIAISDNAVIVSNDGITWSDDCSSVDMINLNSIAYNDEMVVVGGCKNIYYSYDLLDWHTVSTNGIITGPITSVLYRSNGLFYLGGMCKVASFSPSSGNISIVISSLYSGYGNYDFVRMYDINGYTFLCCGTFLYYGPLVGDYTIDNYEMKNMEFCINGIATDGTQFILAVENTVSSYPGSIYRFTTDPSNPTLLLNYDIAFASVTYINGYFVLPTLPEKYTGEVHVYLIDHNGNELIERSDTILMGRINSMLPLDNTMGLLATSEGMCVLDEADTPHNVFQSNNMIPKIVNGKYLYLCGGGIIRILKDDGTFAIYYTGTPYKINDMVYDDARKRYIGVCDNSIVIISTDDSLDGWTCINCLSGNNLNKICGNENNEFITVGNSGAFRLLRYNTENEEYEWTVYTSAGDANMTDIIYIGDGKYAAVGSNSLLMTSTDYGYNWNKKTLNTGSSLYDAMSISYYNGIYIITCSYGAIYTSTDNMLSWQCWDFDAEVRCIYNKAIYHDGKYIIIGSNRTLLITDSIANDSCELNNQKFYEDTIEGEFTDIQFINGRYVLSTTRGPHYILDITPEENNVMIEFKRKYYKFSIFNNVLSFRIADYNIDGTYIDNAFISEDLTHVDVNHMYIGAYPVCKEAIHKDDTYYSIGKSLSGHIINHDAAIGARDICENNGAGYKTLTITKYQYAVCLSWMILKSLSGDIVPGTLDFNNISTGVLNKAGLFYWTTGGTTMKLLGIENFISDGGTICDGLNMFEGKLEFKRIGSYSYNDYNNYEIVKSSFGTCESYIKDVEVSYNGNVIIPKQTTGASSNQYFCSYISALDRAGYHLPAIVGSNGFMSLKFSSISGVTVNSGSAITFS